MEDYIDMGFPSGTQWKLYNEDGFFDILTAEKMYQKQIPTQHHFNELIDNCIMEYDADNCGIMFTSLKNGNQLFFSFDGLIHPNNELLMSENNNGYYWTNDKVDVYNNHKYFAIGLLSPTFCPKIDNDTAYANIQSYISQMYKLSIRLIKA